MASFGEIQPIDNDVKAQQDLPWFSCVPNKFPRRQPHRFVANPSPWKPSQLSDQVAGINDEGVSKYTHSNGGFQRPRLCPVIPMRSGNEIKVMLISRDYSRTVAEKPLQNGFGTEGTAKPFLSSTPDSELPVNSRAPETDQSPATSVWGQPVVLAAPKKSLYRVITTHDFSQKETVDARGLVNNSNMCFFNAVLQALVHCQRFYALLNTIYRQTRLNPKSPTPVLDGLAAFSGQYALPAVGGPTRVLSAEPFYSVILSHPNFRHLERGRQEDAQEFLGYLFDTLESNFDAAPPSEEDGDLGREAFVYGEEDDDESWTEVGKGSKPIRPRHAGRKDYDNPILQLFGGRFRSVLRRPGQKPSVTLDPFQQVPLDISNPEVHTVQQAVDYMLAEEQLMVGDSVATKKLEFDRVPPVLVVTLKRFTFIKQGTTFEFGKITKPIVVDQVRAGSTVYEPFAIVYHHGPSATMGHYTVDVKVSDHWYNIDDDYVVPTRTPGQTDSTGPRIGAEASAGSQVAYIVFYEAKT